LIFLLSMHRSDHKSICQGCQNLDRDLSSELVCTLTGQPGTFEVECPDCLKIEIAGERPDRKEILSRLSSEEIENLRLEQNMVQGVFVSIAAGIAAAILWGMITVATGMQIGYMAVGAGVAVGFSMQFFGKGIDKAFGIAGAVIAFLCCLAGNFLSIIGFLANQEGLGYMETLFLFDYSYLPAVMVETFNPMDILFYGLAIYTGFRFSFRKL
jgi:hypothetical protein